MEYHHTSPAEDRTLHVWKEGPIPIEHAIRGFYSVTLSEVGYEHTAHVLTNELGFKLMGQDGSRFRFQIAQLKMMMLIETIARNTIMDLIS